VTEGHNKASKEQTDEHNAELKRQCEELTEGHNAAVTELKRQCKELEGHKAALKEQHNATVTELKRQCEELTEGHNKALKEQADGHSRTVGSMVGRLNSSLW